MGGWGILVLIIQIPITVATQIHKRVFWHVISQSFVRPTRIGQMKIVMFLIMTPDSHEKNVHPNNFQSTDPVVMGRSQMKTFLLRIFSKKLRARAIYMLYLKLNQATFY